MSKDPIKVFNEVAAYLQKHGDKSVMDFKKNPEETGARTKAKTIHARRTSHSLDVDDELTLSYTVIEAKEVKIPSSLMGMTPFSREVFTIDFNTKALKLGFDNHGEQTYYSTKQVQSEKMEPDHKEAWAEVVRAHEIFYPPKDSTSAPKPWFN